MSVLSSSRGEYGVTNIGKQELTLVQVSPHNDRVFERSKPSFISLFLYIFVASLICRVC